MKTFEFVGQAFVKPSVPGKVGIITDTYHWKQMAAFIKDTGGALRAQFSVLEEPMSRGPRSQMSRFRGGARAIADQLGEYTAKEIADALKRMAVSEGYPTHLSIDGREEPVSTSRASKKEAKILLDVMARFADEHSLWLLEYDENDEPYKSIGGRTREEMKKYAEGQTNRASGAVRESEPAPA